MPAQIPDAGPAHCLLFAGSPGLWDESQGHWDRLAVLVTVFERLADREARQILVRIVHR